MASAIVSSSAMDSTITWIEWPEYAMRCMRISLTKKVLA
jgi:hypothetical protein